MRNKHGVEVAVGLWVTTGSRCGVVQSIEAKQGLRQAFFFEDGSQELVNNVTTSEEFEIKYRDGRWEVSFPWQLQHLDQDFGSVVEAKKYLSRLHPYAKPKLVTALKHQLPPVPASYGRREPHVFDDMAGDIPF